MEDRILIQLIAYCFDFYFNYAYFTRFKAYYLLLDRQITFYTVLNAPKPRISIVLYLLTYMYG